MNTNYGLFTIMCFTLYNTMLTNASAPIWRGHGYVKSGNNRKDSHCRHTQRVGDKFIKHHNIH